MDPFPDGTGPAADPMPADGTEPADETAPANRTEHSDGPAPARRLGLDLSPLRTSRD